MTYTGTGDFFIGYLDSTFNGPGDGIHAGLSADGTLQVLGGNYTFFTFNVGSNFDGGAARTGVLTFDQGAQVLADDVTEPIFTPSVNVGINNATGTLNILGGSVLEARSTTEEDANGFINGGYNNVRIGRGENADGTANVVGAGSQLITSGGSARITVGRDGGVGQLNVTDGGFVGTHDLDVGRDGGDGLLRISGTGSEVRTSAEFGEYGSAYAGFSGTQDFGRGAGGSGRLLVQNGGLLAVENTNGVTDGAFLSFGRDDGSVGRATITGTGSEVRLQQFGAGIVQRNGEQEQAGAGATIGRNGQGVVTVTSGAQLNVIGDDAFITVGRGSDNAGEATNAQSRLNITNGGQVTVDSRGFGGTPETGAPFYRGASN